MMTAQQITAAMITDSQRIATIAITGLEMTFEIGTPYMIAVLAIG